ncbi:unnamed protein product, partial [Allacma fusca]
EGLGMDECEICAPGYYPISLKYGGVVDWEYTPKGVVTCDRITFGVTSGGQIRLNSEILTVSPDK